MCFIPGCSEINCSKSNSNGETRAPGPALIHFLSLGAEVGCRKPMSCLPPYHVVLFFPSRPARTPDPEEAPAMKILLLCVGLLLTWDDGMVLGEEELSDNELQGK